MATQGIESVKIALIDKTTNEVLTGLKGIFNDASDTKGLFTIDETTSYGVVSLNLTGLAGSFTDIYGSNKIVHIAQGKASPQAVLTVNALPNAIHARILGRDSDGKGGFALGQKSNTYLAILAESRESFDDVPVYTSLYKVIAQETASNMQTNNAAENRAQDAITFKALERGDDGFGKFYYAGETDFDKVTMEADVFKTATPAPAK